MLNQIGHGLLQPAGPIDLAPILRLVLRDMGADAGRLVISLPDGPVMATLDPDAFAILARNLIENALKHGAAGQPVQVALSTDGALAVRNAGPVVAPEVMAQLAQPFTRGATPAEGSGLGLAIARAIAAGSGGRLELSSPAPGQASGFEARFMPGQSNQ